MIQTFQLNQQSENTYEFELELEGLEITDVKAWLVMHGNNMELSFPCTQKGAKFTCVIPPVPFLERTAYKACIRLVAEQYFFQPIDNIIIDVVGNLNFEATDVKNMKLAPATVPKFEKKPSVPVKEDHSVKPAVHKNTVTTDVKRVDDDARIRNIAAKVLRETAAAKTTATKPIAKNPSKSDMAINEEVTEFTDKNRDAHNARIKEVLKNLSSSGFAAKNAPNFVKKS